MVEEGDVISLYGFLSGTNTSRSPTELQRFGQFFKVEGFRSRRSIIILEARARNGWRMFGLELRKMLEAEADQYVVGGSGHSKFVAQPAS